MLDLRHPMTTHVFRASGLIDGVMARGHQMSVSPSGVRAELVAECLPLFAEMRELARARFGRRAPLILRAVNEYEAAIRELAVLGGGRITGDRRDGRGACPYCDTAIVKFNPLPPELEARFVIYCPRCTESFAEAVETLRSSKGFGTWAI